VAGEAQDLADPGDAWPLGWRAPCKDVETVLQLLEVTKPRHHGGMRLLSSDYCTIDLDPARGLVRFTRSEVPYRTADEITAEAHVIETVLERVGEGRRLLVDLRAVAPRNDPGFEQNIADLRKKLFGGASAVAILVRTAVGALQVKRHMHEDGYECEVFMDEGVALTHLASALRKKTPSVPPRR
jgi:hypothetical protein